MEGILPVRLFQRLVMKHKPIHCKALAITVDRTKEATGELAISGGRGTPHNIPTSFLTCSWHLREPRVPA